jgi:hypothetical protein
MDWTQVEERIAADDHNKWDRKVPAAALRIADDGALELHGDGSAERFALSEHAIGQMCQRLGIPVRYYRRLPDALKITLANYDLDRLSDRTYLLRGRGQHVRAFLSTDFVPCDNAEIVRTTRELLAGRPITVRSFVLEETRLYLKVISEEIADRDSGLKGGVMIGNSEVGLGSVSIEPFVYRLPCTNDLVVSAEQSFRHPHAGLNADELRKRAALAVSIAFDVATDVLKRFLKTHEEPIADPAEEICLLAEAQKMSCKFADEVIASYAAEPEPTRFGVINAFTRAAQKLGPLQRIEVERFAGSLLGERSVPSLHADSIASPA